MDPESTVGHVQPVLFLFDLKSIRTAKYFRISTYSWMVVQLIGSPSPQHLLYSTLILAFLWQPFVPAQTSCSKHRDRPTSLSKLVKYYSLKITKRKIALLQTPSRYIELQAQSSQTSYKRFCVRLRLLGDERLHSSNLRTIRYNYPLYPLLAHSIYPTRQHRTL